MRDKANRLPMCQAAPDLLQLQRENESLRQENAALRRQTRDVAEANAHAAELMVQREEINENLKDEVKRREQAEKELRRINRDMEERVRARTKELTTVNDELTHFAYIVSHDLKAPLRGITLLTEWLRTDYGDKLGDDAKLQLDLLQSRVGRMHNLIEGILQYSRIGRAQDKVVSIDLNELLAAIVDTIAPPEHIRIDVRGPLPTIQGEKTRVSQVFQNLLTNAVKYMDKPQGRITVACTDDRDVWKFSVTDNGPGIEEKYFDRIFRIFQTLTPKDEYESTGVGLTLVKKIVEQYGGKVSVESVVGQGSTFFFTLPKRPCGLGKQPAAENGARCEETDLNAI